MPQLLPRKSAPIAISSQPESNGVHFTDAWHCGNMNAISTIARVCLMILERDPQRDLEDCLKQLMEMGGPPSQIAHSMQEVLQKIVDSNRIENDRVRHQVADAHSLIVALCNELAENRYGHALPTAKEAAILLEGILRTNH